MYEIRQKKMKAMQQKWWYYYALLVAAIFVFSQGSAIIKTNFGFAFPAIILSLIMHSRSVGNIANRLFKLNLSLLANTIMLVILVAISSYSYINLLKFPFIVILDFAAISFYVIVAAIQSYLKQEK